MEQLWAPWRKAYIRPKASPQRGCLFCRLRSKKEGERSYILKHTSCSFAVLNLYPYNNGHTLIMPRRHVSRVEALSDAEKLDWLWLYSEILKALQRALKPDGFNVGINLGKSAGAGIPGHLHLHLVPRWTGDTNFFPVLAKTKVISESLDSAYRAIRKQLVGGGKKRASPTTRKWAKRRQ